MVLSYDLINALKKLLIEKVEVVNFLIIIIKNILNWFSFSRTIQKIE